MRTLYLCGAGNPEGVRLALAINEARNRWDRIVVLDDDPAKQGQAILGVEIAGPFELLGQAAPGTSEVVNLVARSTAKRMTARERIAEFGLPFASLIHPLVDTTAVTLGDEVTVYTNATLSANSAIGDASVIFTAAVVGHGCRLGRGCVVAPGAVINARVELEDGVYVGTNAAILPDLRIGSWATIGTCSAVIENVSAGATVMGVPAQVLMTSGDKPRRQPAPAAPEAATDADAPRSSTEKALARIWAEVLDADTIGLHDNFFELGADSILAVQVIGRAGQAGIELTVRQLLDHPTIAELAQVATRVEVVQGDQALVTGEVPLTPVQRWFLEQEVPERHHYNQTMLLTLPGDVDVDHLESAFGELVKHHDALRMRFHREGNDWHQACDGFDGVIPFSRVDLAGEPADTRQAALASAVRHWQASLSLAQGPLARAVHFNVGDGFSPRLLLLVHHLAVDGVSWRIMLEDLQQAYEQLSQNRPIELPSKTTSFQQWARGLVDHAASVAARSELSHWRSENRGRVAPLPRDFGDGANTEESARVVVASLNTSETQDLLRKVPAAYNARINDVLLAALAQCLSSWTERSTHLFDLEGHGREDIIDGADTSRTVGWFTSIYPVVLELDSPAAGHEALAAVSEQLRVIPNNGIGYGLLRYLSTDGDLARELGTMPQAEIQFNYLGQFDQMFARSSMFRAAPEPPGAFARDASPLQARPYLFEILGVTVGGELTMKWLYSENVHRRSTVERLASEFLSRLRSFIAGRPRERYAGTLPS